MELTIAQLERTLPSGVVYNIHYRFDLTDGDYSKGAYGTVSVAGDPNAEGFIAYDDLTETTVKAWVTEALGGQEKVDEIEAALQAKIEEDKNPTSATGMPWGE
tara:strand:- start:169 stop:477 length:309 start_codon:yes stop_codon:yes gene_type:complete